ncbi:hypothetical protein R9C00_03360 [Flammeovirgaceae bacterium SG7u.111]|nr:hypothetical protein [Flammeovirgaceae bacterium SG7u.132]WPO36481.1 hypothetical protein R9C00_03360 [Flammeovirgaceae bacterium SG7u.111]
MGLVKLKIKSFTDSKFQQKGSKEFDLPINPEEFIQNLSVKLNTTQAQGTQGNNPRYNSTEPETLALDFVLDGTGVLELPEALKGKSVPEQIEVLRDVVYKLEGDTHEPKYLKILWGEMLGEDKAFECRLSAMNITYTLFSPEAKPLRAKIHLELLEFKHPKKRTREEGKNSPDLTHLRVVKEDDTLPLQTFDIYKDDSYFLEVARVNGLTSFRNIPVGQKLFFPPIVEETN